MKKEKTTVKDYVFGFITGFLLIGPEVIKIVISTMYLGTMYAIFQLNPSNLDKTQAQAVLMFILIGPIGAYYFYEKSLLKPCFRWLIDELAEHTSLITSEKEEEK